MPATGASPVVVAGDVQATTYTISASAHTRCRARRFWRSTTSLIRRIGTWYDVTSERRPQTST